MSLPPELPRHLHTGVCPPARAAVLAELMAREPAPVWLVVVAEARAAGQLAEDTAFFLHAAAADPARPAAECVVLPEAMAPDDDMREAFAASADRHAVLSRLRARRGAGPRAQGPGLVVFTTPAALAQDVPALEAFAAAELTLRAGEEHPFAALTTRLRELDYDSEPVCESPGHYAVRGGIIDVYPIAASQPYRLDFFGDTLEEIRELDPVTQRSGAVVAEITLSASPRLRLAAARAGLSDYLSPASCLVLVEPAELDHRFSALTRPDHPGPLPALLRRVAGLVGVADLDEAAALFDQDRAAVAETTWDTESLKHHRRYPADGLVAQERLQAEVGARAEFLHQVLRWQEAGQALWLVVAKEAEENRIRELLAEEPGLRALAPRFLRGGLNEGFRYVFPQAAAPAAPAPSGRKALRPARTIRGLVVITETELFGRQRPRRGGHFPRAGVQRTQVDHLLDFAELVEGDYVVHLQHGIAHYRGLTRLETRDGLREVISLEFDDHVTLHVPLQESHLLSRYVGLSKTRPQLGRIGTNRWEKTRKAAERATVDLAAELLRIQAARETQPGLPCGPDTAWQREFEAAFPYTETRDQLRAIDETKADMERPRPMDRLICGDVGFGKTEVAIRAAFKAVQEGRQVAVLVPTTVLAQQHLNTFRERMAGYPIAVEMVSRFRTKNEQGRILAATASGQVDILIGTHRLLQRDVHFRELGLVVIDEEQRFGVKHKERFKTLRATVDVLSMSATPIPRTLYLAMTGARDMSVIETPPVNRLPIQTLVKTYEEKLVVEAIRHEVGRGGQVFYLHNRVQTIEGVAARLRELLPDLRIGIGHGQMAEDELERTMTDFVAGAHDVLVCTTIIESGLDIPNCNTILIEGADRFGLSQLYQLRGRVGRFKHQAYAYLLLHRHTRLVEVARERLHAMRTHNQLGAGFRIAMRDLELRGAGNLLGAKQSGHIVGVGFELYCQLLRQSVARLRGEKTAAALRANVKLDFVHVGEGTKAGPADRGRHEDGYTAVRDAERDASGAVTVAPVNARLPAAYIAETRLRIDAYRRLALASTPEALRQLEAEFQDRFGPFTDEVRALLLVTEIRLRAEQKGLILVETEHSRLKCLRPGGDRDNWVMVGTRFPRLTAPGALLRLSEILQFLHNLPALP